MPDLKQALKDYVATSNSGKYSDESELNSKFPELKGYDAQSLKDYVATSNSGKYQDEEALNLKFPEFFTPKKKASSNWGSDSQPKDTATSLVSGDWTKSKTKSEKVVEKVKTTTKTPNYFPKVDTNGVAPGDGAQFDYDAEKSKEVAKSKRIKELETSFYDSTIDNTDDAVAEQRLQDRKNNKGFWNTAEDVTKSAYNTVIDAVSAANPLLTGLQSGKINEDPLADEKKQALQEAKKNKITLSEIQKNARAEEIFKEKEKDNLFIDRANSYLDNLDEKDKDILQQDRLEKGVHLKVENQKKINVVSAMEMVGTEKIKEYQEVEKQLLSLKEKNEAFPKDLYDKYVGLSEEINQIGGNIQKYSDQIQKNKSDLGTAEQEFDLFKRGYGDIDNFIGNAIATTGELANGIFGAVNYFSSLSSDPMARLNSIRGQKAASIIAGSLEEYRGALRKPVESVESVEGFVNYASDLVANQLPVLAVTFTGVGGLSALGLSTTGQTFTKINEEVLTGKAKYSPLQMATIPLLQGGFEVISEIPTLAILKKGSRVIAAAAKGEVDLIKKSGGELFKGYAKDFSKEFGGEHVTNIGQNFNARYVQGKEEVDLLDNTGRVSKDTAFLTTLLQGSPHVAGAVLKIFQSNSDLGVLDENSRKIIEFAKQLGTEGLTDTEKTVIQKQIDKITTQSSKIVANTIRKIGDMPNVVYDEIVSLNSQAGKLKAQAKEIKDGKLPNKEALLTSLGQDYKDLQSKRNGLIDGSITPFDLLSGNEQANRLTKASREITKRDNPDGTKEKFEIKPEDAKKLASETYDKELLAKKENEQNPTPKTQPQAEVPQQAESEKVEDVVAPSVENDNIVNQNEGTSSNNITPNASIRPTNGKVDKSRATEQESVVQESVPSPVDGGEVKGDVEVGKGKQIEPHKEVNTDVETVKKELKLNDVESLIYDGFKDIPKDKIEDKVYDVVDKFKDDKYGEIEAIESKINDVELKIEDNGEAIDKINDDETLSAAKKKKAVALKEKEFKDLQSQQKELEGQKEAVNESLKQIDDVLFHPTEDFNIDLINEVVDKVNNRLETRKSVKEGTNLFPEDANIPEFVAIKKQLIQLTDEKTIADFNNRTAEQIKESEPIIADIKSKAKNAERISKEELEKGIADAEKLLENKKLEEVSVGKKKNQFKTQQEYLKENVPEDAPESSSYYKKGGFLSGKYTPSKADLEQDAIESHTYFVEKAMDKEDAIFDGKDLWIADNEEGVWDNQRTSDVKNIENPPKGDNTSFYEYSIKNGDITANEVVRIIESAGLTVPKSIRKLSETPQPKPTTKEKIAERIKLSDANIEEVRDVVKEKLDAIYSKLGIKPSDEHLAHLKDIKSNGVSFDSIIDIVADLAKAIAKGGIVTSEHIKQAIDAYNTQFDDKIDPKAVEQKINPKAEEKKASNDFKAEPGVSSVLKRLRDGGNDASTNAIIDEVGLNYKQRSQAQVYADGVNFVKDVGIAEAYNAVKNSEVKHSDTINVVYATILQQFPKFAEAEIAKVTDPDELNALVKELDAFHQKIYTEFASRNTDAGQGISMINYIINQDQKIRYSLAQQIKKFQSVNNGVVPPEVLEKMKELEKRYSEANDKIEQLEGLLKDAQEQKDFDNIVDEEKRNGDYKYTQEDFDKELQKSLDNIKKDVAKEKKATPKEYAKKAKVVADTFRKLKTKSFDFVDSDGNVVKIHTDGISWNDAIEFGAKAIEKSGQIADGVAAAIAKIKGNDWYKNLSDKDKSRFKKELENHYNESETANEKSASTKIGKLSVSEEGKISIPNSLIRSLVKDGYDNINKLTAKILEDYKDEFPDLTERDIRDAITKYGKTLEPDNVDPAPLIRKIKRAGKAISAIEDIAKGIRPKRSGLQRDKLDTEERKILRDIKEAMENLPKDPADLSKHLKTSLDAIKTRLNNHIEDLEKQIANKEKFKAEKKSVELDQDAKDLVTKRDGLKAVLEELVNVPKTEDEIYQEKIGIKLKQREKVLADLIAGKKKDVNGANSDWSAEISKVNTEINRLREKQKPVKAEKTEDEKYEADVENKIKSLVKRIDDMKANNPKSNDGKSTVWNNEISELETELKNLKDSKKVVNEPKVTVDKTGKVRIPTEMIKDFISKGGTDLSEFATQVQQSIKDEFPDVTVREIRESVANYGKKANKSRTQITADIQRLKSEEKLRLEYEDLQVRISKEKNQIRKQKLSQTAKRLKEQIKQLQDDLGITETERTNRSVNYTKKRIEILRDKIKNNDFAKKEIKPIAESQELKEARIEKNRVQEEFDYLSYKQELENRTFGDKAGQLAGDLYDSQRLTLATGEVSFVGAQGSLYMVDATFSRKTLRNLVENFKGTTATDWKVSPIRTALKMIKSARSAEAIIKMVNTMGTANNYMDSQRLIKELPDYDIYVKMGIRILGEDVKTQVKDDNFYGNKLLNVLRIPIHLADRVEKKNLLNFKLTLAEESKKRTTIQGYYEKLTTGKVSDKNKKTATEIFDNANPLATFERGNSTFMNFARIDLADTYIAELRAMGKNPIDHIDDFKKLGSAINTITGSGNLNQTVSMALPILNKLMFSARYFAASWNILSPMSLYYLAKLGNYDGMEWNKPSTWKTWKPTVAQKAFVKPVLKGLVAMYGISLLHVAMINAAIDDDDEMTEEEKAKKRAYIEYDSKSSNFMQVNSGNTHTSYFGPYRGNVIFMSKILSGQTKNKKGEIIENGSEFGSRSDFQIGAEYLAGKANPTLGVPLRYMQGAKKEVVNEETGQKENKRMLFNDDVSFGYQLKHNTYPIFAKTVIAVLKEDPVLGAAVYNLLAFTGINTNVYEQKPQDTPEQKLKESQDKIKNYNNLPEIEKIKVDANNRLPRLRGKLTAEEKKKSAIENNTPYYEKGSAEPIELNIEDINDAIESIKEKIERTKKEAGSRYKPPKEE